MEVEGFEDDIQEEGLAHNYSTGDKIHVVDTIGNLEKAAVKEVEPTRIQIHYERWPSKYDEWIAWNSERIRDQYGKQVEEEDAAAFQVGQVGASGLWKCPMCTYENAAAEGECEMCNTEMPKDGSSSTSKAASVSRLGGSVSESSAQSKTKNKHASVPLPDDAVVENAKKEFRAGTLTADGFDEFVDTLFKQAVALRNHYDEMYHKKCQWKEHCKKLDGDLRSLQETNNHLITEFNRVKKAADVAKQQIERQQARISQLLDNAHDGPARDVTMMNSVFPLVTDIRAQFDDFFSQKRNDLMDIVEDYFDSQSIELSDEEQRAIILKTWVAGAELCQTQVNTFRQAVHDSLRLGKSDTPDHATRRFVSSYMQRHHKNQTTFDTESIKRSVYEEVGYFAELGEDHRELKKLLTEIQFLCWLSALSDPKIELFVPENKEFTKDRHERFVGSNATTTKIFEVIWPGLLLINDISDETNVIVKPKVKT